MNHKRVIFVLYSLSVGGAERRAASVANYLVQHGFEVEILLLENPNVKFEVDKRIKIVYLQNGSESYQPPENRVFVFHSRNTSLPAFYSFRLAFLRVFRKQQYLAYEQLIYFIKTYANKIREYIKDKKEYMVVSWMTFANISTCYALRHLKNEKIIVECTSPEAEFPAGHFMNILKKRYYPYASKCICQTPDEADYYRSLKNTKKYVIPNPINGNYPDRFVGIRKKAIVNFCRLEKQKNIPLSINAFELLHREYPDYQLHLFGEGSQKDNLIAYTKKLGLSESVIFFDFDVNLHSRIRDYSMFVTSSDREGMSNSMLEAMAIGLPTISTDCPAGAARMLIKNYENGIVVPMNDKQAMYQAMKYIIDHPNEAESMSQNASTIREKLSMQRIGKMWMDAILE